MRDEPRRNSFIVGTDSARWGKKRFFCYGADFKMEVVAT